MGRCWAGRRVVGMPVRQQDSSDGETITVELPLNTSSGPILAYLYACKSLKMNRATNPQQLPKLDVTGSIPVSRSIKYNNFPRGGVRIRSPKTEFSPC